MRQKFTLLNKDDFFRGRSMNNNKIRGIHQFVFDLSILESILKLMKFKIIFSKGIDGGGQTNF